MKKILAAILALCLAFSVIDCCFAVSGDAVVNGEWKILVPASPTEQETYAANTLSEKLNAVLGVKLPIVSAADKNFIAINSASGADVSGVAENGYVITVKNGSVYINGTGIRGTIAGVYRFLEEFCGYRAFTTTLKPIDEASSFTVPNGTNIKYEPYFEYTDTDWRSPCDQEYSIANGLNGSTYRYLSPEQGGNVTYISNFCHTLSTQFCAAGTYFESHPEYFALRDGERNSSQLCLTNPDVVKIVTDEVLALLAEKHDPGASLQIVSLTQNDNYNYCQCDKCRAFENAHGGVQSATMINFVNQIADVVKSKGYDNVGIDTFAYQYTRKAPTGIAPRDNMIVRLCTIECCFAHALDDPSCERNTDLMKDLEDWSKICGRIYVWDYTTNYAHTCCLFPDFGVIQQNIQVFYEHNVKGVYEEGAYYMSSCDTEFGELRSYMISRCLQDPYCDIDKVINEFLAAYYGDGWQYIREALDLYRVCAGDKDGHLSIYQYSDVCLTMTASQIAKADECWKKAKQAAKTDEQLKNIERSEISWRYWKASAKRGEFSLICQDRFLNKQKLFEDIVASGTKMMSEGQPYGDYIDCASPKFAVPDEWYMYEADEFGTKAINFFGGILEKLMPLLTGFGTLYSLFNSAVKTFGKFGVNC